MYRFTETGLISRDDGAIIPIDAGNRDYADAMAWVAAGNEIAPFVPDLAAEVGRYIARVTEDADARIRTRPIHAEKFAQAMGVMALPEPISDDDLARQFPLVAASLGIEGQTARDVAELFERKYAETVTYAADVERVRLLAEVAIKSAETVQGVREAYEGLRWP